MDDSGRMQDKGDILWYYILRFRVLWTTYPRNRSIDDDFRFFDVVYI